MKLLEDAKVKALEDGKKIGRKEELENKKEVEKRAYENGWREGHEAGLKESREEWEVKYELAYTEGKEYSQLEERKNWVSNHGEGFCASPEVSTPQIRDRINASTQVVPRWPPGLTKQPPRQHRWRLVSNSIWKLLQKLQKQLPRPRTKRRLSSPAPTLPPTLPRHH